MVCLGNICRSPLAEGILRKKALERGLALDIDSAGTSDFHVGDSPDKRTIDNALSHDVDLRNLRGRQFTQEDYQKFDRIFAMDTQNLEDIHALAPDAHSAAKAELLLNLVYPGRDVSVPDPYYGGPDGFEKVFQLVATACDKLVDELENNPKLEQ